MGFILWPAALLIFLFWSVAAWLMFNLSDWAAGQVAVVIGGLLTADLGPWATTAINSLGTVTKVAVVAAWAVVSVGILGAPIWLRRQRRAGQIPDYYYEQGYRHDSRQRNSRRPEYRRDENGFEEQSRRGAHDEDASRDRAPWQQRARQSYGEMSYLRDAVGGMVDNYRRKKRKKRDDDDDDDD